MTVKEELMDAAPTRSERAQEIVETIKVVMADYVFYDGPWVVESAPQVIESALAPLGYRDAVTSVTYCHSTYSVEFKVEVGGVIVEGRISA